MNDAETLDFVGFCVFHIPDTQTVPFCLPDKSSVLPVECRATKCGQHGSLEIQITNVEL